MTPDWPTTRARIIDAFDGELPGAPLEQALVDIYEDNPNAIINAVDSIATSLKNGKINSGWAVLRKAAGQKAIAQNNPTISRDKLIRNADQWLRTAGLMYDRWTEVEDELFGDRGRLRTITTDTLMIRYREAWETIRPDGEQIERDELARATAWKTADRTPMPQRTPQELRALAQAKGNPQKNAPPLQTTGAPT